MMSGMQKPVVAQDQDASTAEQRSDGCNRRPTETPGG
jgi:hypothetical protein